MTAPRTLVAGIGNVFLGDDGFGVEVVRRLSDRLDREDVSVVDFGIRGIDLSYALLDYERVILVDATRRGRPPGTLYVIEPDLADPAAAGPEFGHDVVPMRALSLARAMGARFEFLRVVGCEPTAPVDDVAVGLSPPVAHAVAGAVELIEDLLAVTDA